MCHNPPSDLDSPAFGKQQADLRARGCDELIGLLLPWWWVASA